MTCSVAVQGSMLPGGMRKVGVLCARCERMWELHVIGCDVRSCNLGLEQLGVTW